MKLESMDTEDLLYMIKQHAIALETSVTPDPVGDRANEIYTIVQILLDRI